MNKLILLIALSALTCTYVNGECANACSGHGFCGEYDMCMCNRNYRGADCSERVCPYGHAFVTTPQGDINSDGDRADNTWKRLSVPVQELKINSDTITLDGELKQTTEEIGATNMHRHEVGPGDMIRIGNQVMQVTECRDSTAQGDKSASGSHIAYTCNRILIGWGVGDYEHDPTTISTYSQQPHRGRKATFEFGGRAIQDWSGYSIFKWVGNQYRPEGTWEQWPGDYYGAGQHDGAQDEGHFYMECSNRGICDRKSGECECFDGYTGVGCSRLSCPESCSGHGTCETVDELRQQNPAWQQFSVETYKDSKTVYAEIKVDSTDGTNVVLLQPNDYIKIGHHPPMKINTVAGTTITLYSEFPETLPYGTHAWKVFKYDLWDAKQNRACKCDPLWTGNDCSLRKCPFGDDPLTVVSYDPETEGTAGTNFMNTGTSSTTASAHALYVGYSPYRQKAERQTVEIDSFHRPNSGTFTLTFTDEYGDEWTTRPIPLVVRLSQTLSQAYGSGEKFLDFGNDPGIHKSEISIGDIIRIGNSYRLVTKLEYRRDDNAVVDTSKQYYQKIHFASALADSSGAARSQQSSYEYRTAGTPVYRVTVAKEIRGALRALPNDRITDVTVEAITRGGHVLDQTFTSSGTTLTEAGTLSARTLGTGDIVRFGDEYRTIQSDVSSNAYTIDSGLTASAGSKIFKQNGMKYDITFEQGCRTHEDCRYNGVDENDSDGPPQEVLFEGNNDGAYCHNGGTCMCSDGFYGAGCTKTGRGHHANAKVTVSGDVYNMKCDGTVSQENGVTTGLTASYSKFTLNAGVLRTDPLKVALVAAAGISVGDHVRLENQVRTVVAVAGNDLYVDRPFEEVKTSDITKLFPQYTPLELINDIGGVRSTCTVTDLRQLTSNYETCAYDAGTTTDVRACGHFVVNQAASTAGGADQKMREVNLGVGKDGAVPQLMDEREVEIGDRIRVLTSAGSWQTRTVDSVTYSSNQVTGFVVSEPFESESVSIGVSETVTFASNKYTKGSAITNPGLAVGDFVEVNSARDVNDGVFQIKAINNDDIEFESGPADDTTAAAATLYKAHLAYNDGAGTTEASECSGRGLCDDSSGECQCFKGYTGVDCSIQNALAV